MKNQKELSTEELIGLRTHRVETENGSVIFTPTVRGGSQVKWNARTYIKGVIGPVPLSPGSLEAIGAPEDLFDKSEAFLSALQDQYPAFPKPQLPANQVDEIPAITEGKQLAELPETSEEDVTTLFAEDQPEASTSNEPTSLEEQPHEASISPEELRENETSEAKASISSNGVPILDPLGLIESLSDGKVYDPIRRRAEKLITSEAPSDETIESEEIDYIDYNPTPILIATQELTFGGSKDE